MITIKINSAETWYKATQTLKNGEVLVGYGTTAELAISDCLKKMPKEKKKRTLQTGATVL